MTHAFPRMHGDARRILTLCFTPVTGVPAAEAAAAVRSKLLDLLCNNQLAVAEVVVEPHGIARVSYWEKSEDALFAKKTSDDLHAAGFRYDLSREARAKRTLVIRGVDASLPALIQAKWEVAYPHYTVLQVYHVRETKVLKLTLTSISDAQDLAEDGLTLGYLHYPPSCISFGRYTHLKKECFTCYEPEATHRTKACPLKGQLLCSICGGTGHRHDRCENTDATTFTCLVCSRHQDAAVRAKARHGTRTMACDIRRAVVHKGRPAPPPARAPPQAPRSAPPAAPAPRGPPREWHPQGASYSAVASLNTRDFPALPGIRAADSSVPSAQRRIYPAPSAGVQSSHAAVGGSVSAGGKATPVSGAPSGVASAREESPRGNALEENPRGNGLPSLPAAAPQLLPTHAAPQLQHQLPQQHVQLPQPVQQHPSVQLNPQPHLMPPLHVPADLPKMQQQLYLAQQ